VETETESLHSPKACRTTCLAQKKICQFSHKSWLASTYYKFDGKEIRTPLCKRIATCSMQIFMSVWTDAL